MSKLTSPNDVKWISRSPWYNVMRRTFYFTSVVFFPKPENSSLLMKRKKKKIRPTQVEGHSTEFLTSKPTAVKVRKTRKTEKLSQVRGD